MPTVWHLSKALPWKLVRYLYVKYCTYGLFVTVWYLVVCYCLRYIGYDNIIVISVGYLSRSSTLINVPQCPLTFFDTWKLFSWLTLTYAQLLLLLDLYLFSLLTVLEKSSRQVVAVKVKKFVFIKLEEF